MVILAIDWWLRLPALCSISTSAVQTILSCNPFDLHLYPHTPHGTKIVALFSFLFPVAPEQSLEACATRATDAILR